MIRKPPALEQASRARRVAEVGIEGGRMIGAAGRSIVAPAKRGFQKLVAGYLLAMFTLGAVTASSLGAKLLGLLLLSPFYYIVWNKYFRKR